METEVKWWYSEELFRFVLAMAIFIGFLIILGWGMVGRLTDVPTPAGIFSGWIVAIVALKQVASCAKSSVPIVSSSASDRKRSTRMYRDRGLGDMV
jgi:hypothetical protein